MLNLPTTTRIFVYTQPTDMRKSFEGLSGIIEQVFDAQLLSGDVFVFVNRRRDRLKAMAWDGDGFWIWYKRLEAGTFQLPSASSVAGKRSRNTWLTGGLGFWVSFAIEQETHDVTGAESRCLGRAFGSVFRVQSDGCRVLSA